MLPAGYQYRRRLLSVGARWAVQSGGIGVIGAVTLIFFFLLYAVLPLFRAPKLHARTDYPVPAAAGAAAAGTLHYLIEEYREIGLRITDSGGAIFFRAGDGAVLETLSLLPEGAAPVTAFAAGNPAHGGFVLGLADGGGVAARAEFETRYAADGKRRVVPRIVFPLGRAPLPLDPEGRALTGLGLQADGERFVILARTADERLLLHSYLREEGGLGLEEEAGFAREAGGLLPPGRAAAPSHLLLGGDYRYAYAADGDGRLDFYHIGDVAAPRLVQSVRVVEGDAKLAAMTLLGGGVSLVLGDDRGRLAQWAPAHIPATGADHAAAPERVLSLVRLRDYEPLGAAIGAIGAEHYRRVFAAAAANGELGLYHATSGRTLLRRPQLRGAPGRMAFSPRADALLLEEAPGRLRFLAPEIAHPEFSWRSTWGKVWYEGRPAPVRVWQSSSGSGDFEPKFSLAPLAFGTLKAALYAMLFSLPIAILAAIYTAYFMHPALRGAVKPCIEIMEALPTVILGFLAGLWLAPLAERYLPAFLLAPFLILGLVFAAYWAWRLLPVRIRDCVPEGWEALLLIPVVVLATALAFACSGALEDWAFAGNMPLWLSSELGVDFSQRNSLVVGIAMGFAVIPTVFSISEDAIYGVPRHLTIGSLALGASRWQTIRRVVLLTAAPGIFSAVMLGLGRAVGETMIVVMATGNTAIMDLNLFQGLRAMSANIAIEMPESEVGGTHYRILFLSALVLFVMTFALNGAAEIVRQRFRARYGRL
ncbi:MAG: ABC transporter permease subunit [Gammaproteobacteria bacterium]|nr:ABC transporter permease subunit [Gammaproteobacteria bacterium]